MLTWEALYSVAMFSGSSQLEPKKPVSNCPGFAHGEFKNLADPENESLPLSACFKLWKFQQFNFPEDPTQCALVKSYTSDYQGLNIIVSGIFIN